MPAKNEFDAAVQAVEDRAVDVLEIEGEVEGAAHAPVLELRPAQVEHEGLHRSRRPHREFFPDDAPLPHRREVVGRRPVAGAVLGAEVVAVALEGLEQHGRVAVVLVADLVEIVPAAVHRQIAAPIIGHALVGGGAAGVEALQAIGAGAERRLERGLGRVAAASVRG